MAGEARLVRRLDIIGREALAALLTDEARIIEGVAKALARLDEGTIDAPLPGLLESADPPGDCHIKFARSGRDGLIVVKMATGFYDNGRRGLPVNDGLVAAFDGATGQALALLDDAGLLTTLRTAATGVIAARLGGHGRESKVGIMGTGHQAHAQALWASRHLTDHPLRIFGRDAAKARALATRLEGEGTRSLAVEELSTFCAESDTIILCTSSAMPVLHGAHLRPGHHIVSLGADGPGKRELDSEAYGRSGRIVVDDLAQAVRRSDFAAALDKGIFDPSSVERLGRLLAIGASLRTKDSDITMVNLCGTAAADVALVAQALGR